MLQKACPINQLGFVSPMRSMVIHQLSFMWPYLGWELCEGWAVSGLGKSIQGLKKAESRHET